MSMSHPGSRAVNDDTDDSLRYRVHELTSIRKQQKVRIAELEIENEDLRSEVSNRKRKAEELIEKARKMPHKSEEDYADLRVQLQAQDAKTSARDAENASLKE